MYTYFARKDNPLWEGRLMASSHMFDFHYQYENLQNCFHHVTEDLLKIQQQTTKRFLYKSYVEAKFNNTLYYT